MWNQHGSYSFGYLYKEVLRMYVHFGKNWGIIVDLWVLSKISVAKSQITLG